MGFDRLALAACVLIAGMLLLRWFQPWPMPEARIILPPDLPEISNRLEDDVLSLIKRRNIWDRARENLIVSEATAAAEAAAGASRAAVEGETAADTGWQLIGVSREGRQQLAVVDSRQGMRSYQVGETLPDGAVLTDILAFGIEITRRGKAESVYLFGKE